MPLACRRRAVHNSTSADTRTSRIGVARGSAADATNLGEGPLPLSDTPNELLTRERTV